MQSQKYDRLELLKKSIGHSVNLKSKSIMSEKIKAKQEMSQMMPSGLTADYFNEFGWIPNAIKLNEGEGLPEEDKSSRIKKYTERYNPDIYANVVTPQNEEAIKKLDDIVDKMNSLMESEDDNSEQLIKLVVEADRIVRG